MPSRVTLRDIAEATGLHFTTVGRVLRGDAMISRETGERVRRVAKEMGYVHDPMLSALSAYRRQSGDRHVGTIAVVMTYDPAEAGVRHRRMMAAAEAHANAHGFKLEVIQTNMRPERLNQILVSRGIQGLILPAVQPKPGAFPDLAWEEFSVVALNYSITNLHAHRVCFTQGPSMHLHLRELRELGYRRIGLALTHAVNVRTGFTAGGAYLMEQQLLPSSRRVEPFFPEKLEFEEFARWFRHQEPECVIIQEDFMKDWIERCGRRVPEEVGVSHFALDCPDGTVAGIDDRDEMLGEAAVDMVFSLLRAGERGMPRYPRYTLVEGRWIFGPTVRRL